MGINIWEAQRKAKRRTFYYLTLFAILTLAAAFVAELAMRTFAFDAYRSPDFPYVGLAFLLMTFAVAGFNYVGYLHQGGGYVAESIGAVLVDPYTRDPKLRQLLNIVEEVAVATSLPVPPVYIVNAQEINAFAAGTSPDNAAIAVTLGTLNLLNRDELQGVLAHEFGHVYHQDMKIGMRVAAMIMGFFFVSYVGLRMLHGTSHGYGFGMGGNGRRGLPFSIIAMIFLLIGSFMWFFGSILQAVVSRQREFLADASSVQYTRNPEGLVNALRKIEATGLQDMPKSGKPFAHLYFNLPKTFWSNLFSTHPSIEERIAALEGRS